MIPPVDSLCTAMTIKAIGLYTVGTSALSLLVYLAGTILPYPHTGKLSTENGYVWGREFCK